MSKTDDKINEVLEIADLPAKMDHGSNSPKIPRPKDNLEIDSDYKYSRENLYNLVERGQDAIDGILDLAREGEHPRAYEVAGQLIKNVGDVTDKLLQLQEKMKKLKEVARQGIKNVTNALFVGSTTELNKLLKGKPLKKDE